MAAVSQKTVDSDEAGMRLDRWFKSHFPGLGFGALQKLLRTGQVRIDGKRAKADTRLEAGQAIRLPPQVTGTDAGPVTAGTIKNTGDADALRRMILYEDDKVFVFNKPAGLAVQGGSGVARHVDGMLDALRSSDVVVLTPMSPVLDGPGLLGVPGVRDALRGTAARVVVMSPVGLPTSRDGDAERSAWSQAGLEMTSAQVAKLYADFADVLLIDEDEAQGSYPGRLNVTRAPLARALVGDVEAARELRQDRRDQAEADGDDEGRDDEDLDLDGYGGPLLRGEGGGAHPPYCATPPR